MKTAAALLVGLAAASPDGKCRVLAMRGGGIHGAFEVGVLKAFTDTLKPIDYYYDVLSGVSVGALNAGLMSVWDYGKEREAVAFLEKLYTENLIQDFWDFWPTVIFEPFFKTSFVDVTKIRKILHQMMSGKEIKRKISIQSVDLITGKVVIFDETVEKSLIEDVLFSSASIPAIFPPVQIGQFELVDGGTFQNLAVGDPIERCREEGYKDQDIIVDVILCFSSVVDYEDWTLSDSLFKDARNFYERRAQIADFYSAYEDLLRITRGYPKVDFRYAVAPTMPSPSQAFVPIIATHEEVAQEIKNGYYDGLRAIRDAHRENGSNWKETMKLLQEQAAHSLKK